MLVERSSPMWTSPYTIFHSLRDLGFANALPPSIRWADLGQVVNNDPVCLVCGLPPRPRLLTRSFHLQHLFIQDVLLAFLPNIYSPLLFGRKLCTWEAWGSPNNCTDVLDILFVCVGTHTPTLWRNWCPYMNVIWDGPGPTRVLVS